ncbi:conserved membrane hypothetical protein [Candidatus Terasakiella magnetica]|uniref:DUF4159 domain-containing protein n=1 Tax=Candidatus Terasakiella magnetica TaxID=1867952 RepID=A0A1C3RLR7_9PROT|nr:DUF4159 domain-containing protein [Candidatus Terasakiella magnetica]SCA58217.1 conserved membrane hypothetical protein [Candidatus Terasakiella magnetica]
MLSLGSLSFATPWALTALLLLPLLWQLLKVTPPKPTVIKFPAVRILQELSTKQTLATQTPWWIFLLRGLIALCLILAMSGPSLNRVEQINNLNRPHIIIVDNDWSVMDRWAVRKSELIKHIRQSQENQHGLALITNTQTKPSSLLLVEKALEQVETLRARPWAGNRKRTLEHIEKIIAGLDQTPKISWISNGLKEGEDDDFLSSLHGLGDVDYIHEGVQATPIIIQDVKRNEQGFDLTLLSAPLTTAQKANINIVDETGSILFQQNINIPKDQESTTAQINIPSELKSRAFLIRLSGYINPASQFLVDEKWRDRPVGILSSHEKDKALLEPAYYVRKSLKPHTSIRESGLEDLIKRKTAVIFDVVYTAFSARQQKALQSWMAQGGILVRFATKRMTSQDMATYDPLLPVQLMPAQRTFGGALSWGEKSNLAEFPEHSPFAHIKTPDDVAIKKQVLARPESNLAQKTWAHLKDGTPLITAQQIDKGWSVLFHINAIPSWSNLPLSGVFELMMKRIITLSSGYGANGTAQELVPYRLFNHLGNLVAPERQSATLSLNKAKTISADESHPPGLYGSVSSLHAFNLGPLIRQLSPLKELPLGVSEKGFREAEQQDLALWFLLCALVLVLIDWLLANTWLQAAQRASLAVICFLVSLPVHSAEPNWEKALASANQMRLAYMVSPKAGSNKTLQQGLDGLAAVLRRRTAVELAPSVAFDPEKDDPSLFPMIYWAIEENQTSLSDHAAQKLNQFLKTGGFILFDTMGQARPQILKQLTEKLEIAPLELVKDTHVLTRSFYLMRRFPGRFDHQDIWVESDEDTKNDRVSSVLIGSNSWAQAWARDENLRPVFAVVPAGEIQREQAFRFGVNLVMYILSGNYKGDQVHMPAILQRLGL